MEDASVVVSEAEAIRHPTKQTNNTKTEIGLWLESPECPLSYEKIGDSWRGLVQGR